MNKPITLTIVVLGITIVASMLFGCVCPQCDKPTYEGNPEFKPLPPEKLHDLLHVTENYAYKSVTHEDYKCDEECQNGS